MRPQARNTLCSTALLVFSFGLPAAQAEELPSSTDWSPQDAGAPADTRIAFDAGTGQISDLPERGNQAGHMDAGKTDAGDLLAPEGIVEQVESRPEVFEASANDSLRLTHAREAEPGVDLHDPPVAPTRLSLIGVMADIGVPDGLMGAVAVRPWKWLRVSAGGGTNSISHGWRAGITLLPFGAGPSASFEYGRYQDGDANGLAKKFVGEGFDGSPALKRVGYEFMNAHVGLDFGSRNFFFFIHGGVTVLRGRLHNLEAAIREGGGLDAPEVVVREDPRFKAMGPSFKLGLLVYVW